MENKKNIVCGEAGDIKIRNIYNIAKINHLHKIIFMRSMRHRCTEDEGDASCLSS